MRKKVRRRSAVEVAFDAYVKREFPRYGMDGEAWIETIPVEHFMAGWEAALLISERGAKK